MPPALPLAFALLLALPFALPATRADNAAGAPEIIVAVIDTGADVHHPEFDYTSKASPGQITAWWDFTTENKPASDVDPFQYAAPPTWDVDIADPYDGFGHGTATASLVGGHDVGGCGSTPKLSFAPGVKLAIAKVGNADGSVTGDLGLAMRWATDVVHADVISMSIGAVVPFPNLGDATFADVHHARAQGVLPVFLAHNGVEDFGLAPYPSWMSPYASSPDAFVVGGGSFSGNTLTSTTGNDDPDVSSWSDSVCVAHANHGDYAIESGTSFSTPLVAGMAAKAMQLALANGHSADPDSISTLLKHCARDTVAPYTREGWGFLLTTEFDNCVAPNAASGTTPTYVPLGGAPVNTNELYDSTVRAAGRDVFSASIAGVPSSFTALVRTPAPAQTAPGRLGASTPIAMEAEGYRVHLAAGERARLAVRYTDGAPALPAGLPDQVPDFDAAVWPAGDFAAGILPSTDKVASSGQPGLVDEAVDFTAPQAGDYVLVVYGFAVGPNGVGFSVDGGATPVAFEGQGIWTGQAAL